MLLNATTLARLGRLRAATDDRVVVPIQHHDSTAATARAESANHCESQRLGTPHALVALANMMESADWAAAGIRASATSDRFTTSTARSVMSECASPNARPGLRAFGRGRSACRL